MNITEKEWPAFNVALNAARIAMELPDDAKGADDIDLAVNVAHSAEKLANLEEDRRPWAWENAIADWETACAKIAARVAETGKSASKKWILKMLERKK